MYCINRIDIPEYQNLRPLIAEYKGMNFHEDKTHTQELKNIDYHHNYYGRIH